MSTTTHNGRIGTATIPDADEVLAEFRAHVAELLSGPGYLARVALERLGFDPKIATAMVGITAMEQIEHGPRSE